MINQELKQHTEFFMSSETIAIEQIFRHEKDRTSTTHVRGLEGLSFQIE